MKFKRCRVIRFYVIGDPVPGGTPLHETVDFIPYNNVPGWTHRIAINGVLTKLWLSDTHKPSAKTAEFFYKMNKEQ